MPQIRFQLMAIAAASLIWLVIPTEATAQVDADWTGNMARDPSFEEDFVNLNGEGHVLSFKGDWYYNQQDRVPDYWSLIGNWSRSEKTAHRGRYFLKLQEGATAAQTFVRAISQEGGGAWGGSVTPPLPIAPDEVPRFTQPWRARVWCRGGGSISLDGGKGKVSASAKPGGEWELVTVELPPDQIGPPEANVVLSLQGPGEFDDAAIQEKLSSAPNLLSNSGFEVLNGEGYPVGWSPQRKFRAIGPTYYVWTDWNHYFRENRGPVTVDPLVMHNGQRSLRFDVFPGDEKLVESDLIPIQQDQPRIIEVGVYVRADRIRLIDIRCVDQDGLYMPAYRPTQPENATGGSATFGNGTFEWRYVRKFFGSLGAQPLKSFRVRLCARGLNGHTLDDAGTRSYAMQVGTVWWDDLRVTERTTDAAMLSARSVKLPPAELVAPPASEPVLDLGQRFIGPNQMTYAFTNRGENAKFQLRLTTTLPGAKPVATTSPMISVPANERGTLVVPYTIERPVGVLEKQGSFKLELWKAGQQVAAATYAFNNWPVVVDIDVSRHYNLPAENPVTVSANLGVSDLLLAKVKKLEFQLYRPADKKVLGTTAYSNLQQAFADTVAQLPILQKESYEFNLPTPSWWVDRTNLIIAKIDFSPLKIWPHDQPTRDTVLVVRGLDENGAELFRDQSDPFCRTEPPPQQVPIEKVEIRDDGAVLVNGAPRYLSGATHQHTRLNHDYAIISQLGLMGHRLTQGEPAKFENLRKLWSDNHLYALQIKPVSGQLGTEVNVDLDASQKAAFEAFATSGGMQNVISVNTGGWEAIIDYRDPLKVAKHVALNDWIRKLTNRPVAISTSGAYNAWWLPQLTFYDINHAETEMWGPMDFNVIFTPYMKKARGKNTAWVYLPQLYDNHPFERYRFETYENIIRGSAGVSMIQGIGDPTFNRGLAGELRYLEKPLNSLETAPAVALTPNVSHKVSRYQDKTYLLATNAGPVTVGEWKWNEQIKHSGRASHEGDSPNSMWFRPGGVRIHGFRGTPLPEMIQPGDKIVQYVWLDPQETPEWVMLAVRGDGRFSHCGVLGTFDFATFRNDYGNILMYSELEHSVWHEINWVMDDPTYARALKILGPAEADQIKQGAAAGRATVDKIAYQAEHFQVLGTRPKPGAWHRIEFSAEQAGLVGKLVDGFAYLSKNGRALWDYSALERDGKVVRVFCEDTVGIDRALLADVRIQVPGLKQGTPIKVLFENRTIAAGNGSFSDNFEGVETYGYESGAVIGDLFGFVRDPDRELPRMAPSGYGYSYGPTAVHIYEIPTD